MPPDFPMKSGRTKIVDLAEQLRVARYLPGCLVNTAEKWLGLDALNVAHARIEDDWAAGSCENFFNLACKHLNLNYDVSGVDNIPTEGACVIVSNHPHGMSDGLMFGAIAMRRRSDIRIVVNDFLYCVRGMRPYEITVDVYGGEAAKRANTAGMREMLKWLRDGHCLLVFPSGSAATFSWRDGRVIDDPWQKNISAVILKTGATVVPMHIAGRTGIFFQVVSMFSRRLRGNFLPREILRDGRMRHRIRLGTPIRPTVMSGMTAEQLTDYLRLRVMLLRYDKTPADTPKRVDTREVESLDAGVPTPELRAEIESLPADALCYANDSIGLHIYAARAQQIPKLMREIGVQRERTFREVGEGTGHSHDVDRWDAHYVHLIMWDTKAERVAGAYRIGKSDEIIKNQGITGIYNSTFFRFQGKFLKVMKQGLEMGRAFITPEYQRLPASLDTLWMGIGRFLNKNPMYKYLYGTISISADYSTASRALILSYLKQNFMFEPLCSAVQSKVAPKGLELLSEDARLLPLALPDLKALSSMVSEMEGGMGIPILLKQYMRLGGKMISFAIDKDFGGTLDCLVVVDLENAPLKAKRRYRGDEYIKQTISND